MRGTKCDIFYQIFVADVVRHFNNGRPEVDGGGRGAQPKQIQGGWHPFQLQGVLRRVAMPAWQSHEPASQVHPLVRRATSSRQIKFSTKPGAPGHNLTCVCDLANNFVAN